MRRLFLAAACMTSLLSLMITPAHAQPAEDLVKRLDDQLLQTFIDDTQRILSGEDPRYVTGEEIANYFVNHMTDDADIKTILKYELDDYKGESQALFNKQQILGYALSGQRTMREYKNSSTLKSADISADGRSASVHIDIHETGLMSISGQGGVQTEVMVQAESQCVHNVVLSWNHFMQLKKADCTTVVRPLSQ